MAKHSPHGDGPFFRLMNMFGLVRHPADQTDKENRGQSQDADQRRQEEAWNRMMAMPTDRQGRYLIFEEMDNSDLVTSILDIYSEEATPLDVSRNQVMWVESADERTRKDGNQCLVNVQAGIKVTPIARRVVKYGDSFHRLTYATRDGVMGWQARNHNKVFRTQDRMERLVGFKEDGQKFRGDKKRPLSYPWDYIHFRLLGKDDLMDGYGTSILESMFRPWRMLALAEDAMLKFRLRRAPDRNMVTVTTGDLPFDEQAEVLNSYRKAFSKTEYVDPASGNYSSSFNPMTAFDDVVVPRSEGQTVEASTLSGTGDVGNVYDLDHFRRKFFGASKVPQAYLGFEGDINAKATLIQQDTRFARSVKRVRQALVFGFRQLLDIHYALKSGSDGSSPYSSYLIGMAPISYVDELQHIELIRMRYEIAEAVARLGETLRVDPKQWATYILLEYVKLPEDFIEGLIAKIEAPPSGDAGGDPFGEDKVDLSKVKNPKVRELLEAHRSEIFGRMSQDGHSPLTESQKKVVRRAISASPALRFSIEEVTTSLMEDIAIQQTDPSLLEVPTSGAYGSDDLDEQDVRELKEDIQELKDSINRS